MTWSSLMSPHWPAECWATQHSAGHRSRAALLDASVPTLSRRKSATLRPLHVQWRNNAWLRAMLLWYCCQGQQQTTSLSQLPPSHLSAGTSVMFVVVGCKDVHFVGFIGLNRRNNYFRPEQLCYLNWFHHFTYIHLLFVELANRTECSMIRYWHHTLCLSVRL